MVTQNKEVVRFLANLLVKMVCDEVSLPQAVRMVNKFADSLPVEQRSDARAYMTDYVFTTQESMQREPPQPARAEFRQYAAANTPSRWDELWATIKTHLPPAMIDTPEKERKTAWRIGFLMGYGAVNATAAAIREYGLTGGLGVVALLGWVWGEIRRR